MKLPAIAALSLLTAPALAAPGNGNGGANAPIVTRVDEADGFLFIEGSAFGAEAADAVLAGAVDAETAARLAAIAAENAARTAADAVLPGGLDAESAARLAADAAEAIRRQRHLDQIWTGSAQCQRQWGSK
jgi:uncharacterized phage protein gp47/JayE